MYDMNKRERVEAYPKKGTKEKLKRIAEAQGLKLAAFVVNLLEERAEPTPKKTK